MDSIIFKGFHTDDKVEIFGQNEAVLTKMNQAKSNELMTRIYQHKFMVKLPHSLLLSQNKKTLLSKEESDKILYEHFMKKMDVVKNALVNCTLSEMPEKVQHQDDDSDNISAIDSKHGFEDLIIRERAQYTQLTEIIEKSVESVLDVLMGRKIGDNVTKMTFESI